MHRLVTDLFITGTCQAWGGVLDLYVTAAAVLGNQHHLIISEASLDRRRGVRGPKSGSKLETASEIFAPKC
jgi:hypothetical protein